MDSHCISSFANGFESNQYSGSVNGIETVDPFMVTNYHAGNPAYSQSTISTDEDESDDYTVLRYINQMLMEEDMEEKSCMFHDSLALQAAEESLYESPPLSAAEIPRDNMRSSNNGNGFMGAYRTGFPDSTSSLKKNVEVVVTKKERDESYYMPKGRRKNHEREYEVDLEDERSNKQSAVYVEDDEGTEQLSALFDKILIGPALGRERPLVCIFDKLYNSPNGSDVSVKPAKDEELEKCGDHKKSRVRKQSYKNKVVDIETLLIQCAQAVSTDNRVSANELLKQIRQHSSSVGSGSQRLAHCFANALEARLAGTGTQIYTALSSKRTSAADMIKAYQMYITACPFQKMALILANHTIQHLAREEELETLHIIDFGILYGFQWPSLIHRLSIRPGNPKKLRITGIDLPQPGFRPAERVQETGRRLARYCKRFNVPFEYNGIAQKWETIKVEDLKIKKNEFVAVNCMIRFKNLVDETVSVNSPRDAVLRLIRKAKPNIFVQGIVNGCYNAPFFVTRFREALFHYSSLFDVLDTTVDAEDPMRLMFEKEFLGREVMNIIACEGTERVERPETYKQWQVRNMKAGFRQIPLDHRLIHVLKHKLRNVYHSDFMLDVDGNWMLQGWKGRIVRASSCWVPS
ncbi:scarecrow-like protein 14 [Senna tora]|uniref:Scarecrow-like protein 14 n=1 Tax=Senna tora TaxID=362788 RepID=A0A834TLY3_9FABA|nr:scarecrow-like protein 14 [Senna tora]